MSDIAVNPFMAAWEVDVRANTSARVHRPTTSTAPSQHASRHERRAAYERLERLRHRRVVGYEVRQERLRAIRAAVHAGLSTRAIAEALGLSMSRVGMLRRDAEL